MEKLTIVATAARLFSTVLRRKKEPYKYLEVSVLGRGIVAEIPEYLPFKLVDLQGQPITDGVYIAVIRLWNRGTLPILPSDIPASAPLLVTLGDEGYLLGANGFSTVDGLSIELQQNKNGTLEITIEGLNPGDDIHIPMYYTSKNPYLSITASGRILGQQLPIDLTGREGLASTTERLAAGTIILLTAGTFPAVILPSYLIWKEHGLNGFLEIQEISHWLTTPLSLGLTMLSIFLVGWIATKLERRKHPESFPLRSDLEPTLRESLKGLWLMLITGRRYRISSSIFTLGEPVIMAGRKIKKRSISDWVQ